VKTTKDNKKWTLERALPYVLIVLSIFGFICSAVIMYDKLQLLQNPNYHPSCSINPVLSCGSVAQSPQSHIFGFSNPLIGLATFPMLLTMGVLMLAGASRFKRWVWLSLQGGTVFGVLFIHWLFFESVYRIHALCIYCMGVWIVTIALFWYVLLYNLRTGHIKTPGKLKSTVALMQRHHLDILVIWYLIITALILHHFWYYFGPHFR